MYQTKLCLKVQKGWRGGLQSDRQSHRLVITRSRLTKPHDSAVSHEPPYMCAEATLIAFVIAQRPHAEDGAPLVMRAHLALPHPCGVLERGFCCDITTRNFFSFLVCFPFSSSFSCQDRASKAGCLPMSESQRQLSQSKPAAGSGCKGKV